MRLGVLLSLLFSVSISWGYEVVCDAPADKVKPEYRQQFYCGSDNELTREEILFVKTGLPSQIIYYKENRMVRKEVFNIDYERTTEIEYSYNDDGTYIKLKRSQGGSIDQELYEGSPEGKSVKIKKWYYDDEVEGDPVLQYANIYDYNDSITSREIFNESGLEGVYKFNYPSRPTIFNHIDGFSAILSSGEAVEYDYRQGVDVYSLIGDLGFSYEEEQRRLEIFEDHSRERVLIIDTGFDVKHPDLIHKFYQNQKDPVDGVDNDSNGIVDDFIGFNLSDLNKLSNNVNERLTINTTPSPLKPFSHGTHVATTALRNLDEYALVGVSGNMSDIDLIERSSKILAESQIRFSNMSFSFGGRRSPIAPDSKSFKALKEMISSNPQTLFTVASGNDGINLDQSGLSAQYPASYNESNLLVVGALDTGVFKEGDASLYQPADFSNRGVVSVDIFAPGSDVEAGNVGGGYIKASGTSMAAPYALNVTLKMGSLAPHLSAMDLKQAVLYSAYIPNIEKPLDCQSGGVLFERRALKVVELMATRGLTAKSAALIVRKDKDYILVGEDTDQAYIDKVMSFWSARLEL